MVAGAEIGSTCHDVDDEDRGRQRKMSVTILIVDAGADTGKIDGVVLMIL